MIIRFGRKHDSKIEFYRFWELYEIQYGGIAFEGFPAPVCVDQPVCIEETLFHSASLIFLYPFSAFSKLSSLRFFLKSSPSSSSRSFVVISEPFSSSFPI